MKRKKLPVNYIKFYLFHNIISKFILASIFFIGAFPLYAYKLDITIENSPDNSLYLARHKGPDIEIIDTTLLHNGKAIFEDNIKLIKGVYFIVIPPYTRFDFIIQNTDTFEIKTNYINLLNELKISGEKEYQLFVDLQKDVSHINLQRSQLNMEKEFYQNYLPDTLPLINQKIKELDNLQFEIYSNYKNKAKPESFLYKILTILEPFNPPEEIESLKYSDPQKYYIYYKSHYLDRVDFTEENLIYTPEFVFHKILEDYCFYFFDSRVNNADEVFPDIDSLIMKTQNSEKMNQYVLSYLISRYEKPNDLRLEKYLVYIYRNYFLANPPKWLTEQAKAIMDFTIGSIQYNLIGQQAKDLQLTDIQGDSVSIYNLNAEYKILLFWEPDCDICNETVFRLLGNYNKIKELNAEIFAVLTGNNEEEWKEFIMENDIPWINAYDPERKSGFETYYGTYKTPRIYILDNSNIILTKDIKPEKITEFIINNKKRNETENNGFIHIFGQ